MATPGELVHCIASMLKVPVPTVVQYDRNLAAAGLRSKGGRGLSAARVTSQDAANLLIAIVGAPMSGATVKETLATWHRFSPLRADLGNSPLSASDFSHWKRELPTLSRLRKRHTFRDAIAALIDSAARGEFENSVNNPVSRTRNDSRIRLPRVYISISAPLIGAHISVQPAGADHSPIVAYRPKEAERHADTYGDLSQQRTISLRTILTIAQTIGPPEKRSRRRRARPDTRKERLAARPK